MVTHRIRFRTGRDGKARIEIDESKLIGNAYNVIWMFGLIDRADKQARVYWVINDRLAIDY